MAKNKISNLFKFNISNKLNDVNMVAFIFYWYKLFGFSHCQTGWSSTIFTFGHAWFHVAFSSITSHKHFYSWWHRVKRNGITIYPEPMRECRKRWSWSLVTGHWCKHALRTQNLFAILYMKQSPVTLLSNVHLLCWPREYNLGMLGA